MAVTADDKLEVVHPVHPLPDEIRQMKRDETVCKYCGVSYLIHNEIKLLENRLKAAEAELTNLRGREDREKALTLELESSSNALNNCRSQ